jgi:tetratricopeptide (TPR) repeat protein
MTVRLINPRTVLLVALVFVGGVLLFGALNQTTAPRTSPGGGDAAAALAHPRTTDELIASLQAIVRANPRSADEYVLLADAYMQKVRETGDAGFYRRSEGVLAIAHRLAPRDSAVYTGLGTLALSRHDFRAGLAYGLRAHALAPDLVRPLGVIVDAQVELGRYGDAGRTLQRMIDAKPNLSSYARASYFRELHGDLAGAEQAMQLAVDAGGEAPENVAYVQSLLGQLEFTRGEIGAAQRAYRLALYRFPGYAPAEAGLARVELARGELKAGIRRLRGVVNRLPLPEYVIALGEAEQAAGLPRRARDDLALVDAERRLLAANGVNTDTEIALFEADHGSPARAVTLGRRAWRNAPSVRSADALGWALTAAGHPAAGLAWAHRALRLGSRDPMFLYHAGMSARAAGARGQARTYLTRALSLNPHFSPLYAPRARRALR